MHRLTTLLLRILAAATVWNLAVAIIGNGYNGPDERMRMAVQLGFAVAAISALLFPILHGFVTLGALRLAALYFLLILAAAAVRIINFDAWFFMVRGVSPDPETRACQLLFLYICFAAVRFLLRAEATPLPRRAIEVSFCAALAFIAPLLILDNPYLGSPGVKMWGPISATWFGVFFAAFLVYFFAVERPFPLPPAADSAANRRLWRQAVGYILLLIPQMLIPVYA
jgi:hypothetical protein